VLPAELHAKHAARHEELRVPNVALGEGPQEVNAAQHARLPDVFGAQVAE
jgi:hypothetical protein